MVRYDIFDSTGRTLSMHETLEEAIDNLRNQVRRNHLPLTIFRWDDNYDCKSVFPYVNITTSEMYFIDAPIDNKYYATIDVSEELKEYGFNGNGHYIIHFVAESDAEAVFKARERGLVLDVFKFTADGLSVDIPLE